MGVITKISWCDHTFNPWWGCAQVSPLCDHCYAMMLDVRWFRRAHWGPRAPRRHFGAAHWREPLRWNCSALVEGRRHRVFCASMADVFDNEVEQAARDRLWRLIRHTPNLDWVVLTKTHRQRAGDAAGRLCAGYPNVWLLVSVDQAGLDRDVPKLLEIPAVVRGLSIQPQLAPVRLGKFAGLLQWVINGGESEVPGARPFHLEWARSLSSPNAETQARRSSLQKTRL